ncbi:MAG: hypothetical protein AUK03_08325 [Anaerolineae bacterium CG2_30_64_16]|nr:MAG: hypothetical protein AUK03_08325 [Anaerolineae bacterium CG2_30_64_16]
MTSPDLPPGFESAVHEALQLWHKDPSFGSPLAHLTLVRRGLATGGESIRRATNQALLAALDALAGEREADAALLRARFLDGKAVYAVANARNVAEVTIYKMQRRAIGRLAAQLLALEQVAGAEQQAILAARLPRATYSQLIGIASHERRLRDVLLAPAAPWLVSIEGLGGSGKTALAHKLVSQLARGEDVFLDFGWVSAQQRILQLDGSLRSISDPALTSEALVEALLTQLSGGGATPAPLLPDRARQALAARLHATPHLVVVDNLETVQDVESLLPTLMALAGPTKFLLTSRETFRWQADIYHFPVPELGESDALSLVRHEARMRNLAHVAAASDADLRPIFETVGGNPLALRLVTGQLYLLPLPHIIDNLREAQGKNADELYRYIYWDAWNRLPEDTRDVLALMPLFAAESGADLAAIERVSDLQGPRLVEALEQLTRLSLVNVSGDLHTRRYSIHRLTESFLLNEVIKWRGGDAPC